MSLSEFGFIDLLREVKQRCAEPFHDSIPPEGREATERIRMSVESYLEDLGWNRRD